MSIPARSSAIGVSGRSAIASSKLSHPMIAPPITSLPRSAIIGPSFSAIGASATEAITSFAPESRTIYSASDGVSLGEMQT
jgi:hypothetical protein